MCGAKRHVRFAPKSGHVRCSSRCPIRANSGHETNLVCHKLFDDRVSTAEHRRRNCEAQFLSGFKIDHQLVLGRRLYWKVTRLLALENTIDIASRLPELVNVVSPIRDQAAGGDEIASKVDGR